MVKRLFKDPGKGIYNDIKARLPLYKDDWVDSWNYRVIPGIIYILICNILPALCFSQDLTDQTDHAFGVNETLLSSAIAGIAFGLVGHGIVIVGVTGPICIFYITCADLIPRDQYFQFMCWTCLWSMVMHFVIAIFNWVSALKYITSFSCDIFGFFICIIYIEKGIQILLRQFDERSNQNLEAGYLSVMVALLMLMFGLVAHFIGNSKLFNGPIRTIFSDYGTPLAVVFFTGFVHFGHRLSSVDIQTLPISKAFYPTDMVHRDGWFIKFWHLPVDKIFIALPFGFLLTVLFYFDHNVSSLMAQGSEFPLKKPSAFHWEFFLLGITTGISGLIGIPPPNGLIPQAPLHTQALCVVKTKGEGMKAEKYVDSVVEQRLTNTAQGLLTLVIMTRPLLVVLHLVPQGVLAGLFWIMGLSGLLGNTITSRLKFIFGDSRYYDPDSPLLKVRKSSMYLFVAIELIGAAAEVGISQSVSAIGFPAVLLLFAAIGHFMYKIIPREDVAILDSPAASEFILQNL